MTGDLTVHALSPGDHGELLDAVAALEQLGFVAKLADYAGQPLNRVIGLLPNRLSAPLRDVVRATIFKCLELALASLDAANARPSPWVGKIAVGLSGGIGGFFGPLALPVELPLTTTLMLRGIAEIARDEGEDLGDIETRLACLEVFALGGREKSGEVGLDYYATRLVLSKLTADMARLLMERGAYSASSPIVAKLIGEIVARFGLVVSDRAAAGVVPVIGAVGGAGVNMIFMDHFQRVARGHFAIRRLERRYGVGVIRAHYHETARRLSETEVRRSVLRRLFGWR